MRIFAAEDGTDWIDGMRRTLEDPTAIWEYVIRLVRRVGADALRMFVKPEPIKVVRVDDDLIIGVGAMRRRVRLASVLRRCIVVDAALRDNQLTVRFRPNPEVWPA
mgnify:CR=1 FL=1